MLHWKGTAPGTSGAMLRRQSHAHIVPGICMSIGLRMLREDVNALHSLGSGIVNLVALCKVVETSDLTGPRSRLFIRMYRYLRLLLSLDLGESR